MINLKGIFERASRFVESRLGSADFVFLGCDIDRKGNVHLYSNARLDGYSESGRVYEKVVQKDEVTGKQRNALNRYLVVGPSLRKTNLPDSDEIYTKDLETDLFGINEHPEYVFVPAKNTITKEIVGDRKTYNRMKRKLKESPGDSVLVHECAHRIPPEIRNKLAERFGLGMDEDFSREVQEEMFAKYTEMLYLLENYPGIARKRKKQFEREISEGEKESPHGRDPHPAASKLFFVLEERPELRDFVDSLYADSSNKYALTETEEKRLMEAKNYLNKRFSNRSLGWIKLKKYKRYVEKIKKDLDKELANLLEIVHQSDLLKMAMIREKVGEGRLLYLMSGDDSLPSEIFGDVTYLDHDPESVKNLREKGMRKSIQGDALNLPFRDKTFDLAFLKYPLVSTSKPENDHDERYVKEVDRVLRNGGSIIFVASEDYIEPDILHGMGYVSERIGFPEDITRYGGLAGELNRHLNRHIDFSDYLPIEMPVERLRKQK